MGAKWYGTAKSAQTNLLALYRYEQGDDDTVQAHKIETRGLDTDRVGHRATADVANAKVLALAILHDLLNEDPQEYPHTRATPLAEQLYATFWGTQLERLHVTQDELWEWVRSQGEAGGPLRVGDSSVPDGTPSTPRAIVRITTEKVSR